MADYSGRVPSLSSMDSPQYSQLISYHPANDATVLHTLHHYYSKRAFKASLDSTHQYLGLATTACNDLSALQRTQSDSPASDKQCEEETICPILHNPVAAEFTEAPPQTYYPSTIFNYMRWQYFNKDSIFDANMVSPVGDMKTEGFSAMEVEV